jgi:hypothetical protein
MGSSRICASTRDSSIRRSNSHGYQQPYGQQPRQPSFSPDPQYGAPPGQPPYQHRAQYPGKQAYTRWRPEQYDPELHRQRLRDQFTHWQADPGRGSNRIAATGPAA